MRKLFISYAREDVDRAMEVESNFSSVGDSVYRDESRLEGGTDWPRELEAAAAAADVLAAAWPDAFLPNLAMSISVASGTLFADGRAAEAAQSAQEALEILAPVVERYPQAYGDVAKTMGAHVLRYCDAAGVDPDMEMLDRVARVLGDRGSTGRP